MSTAQPISPNRLAANRANAQFSTGPKTPEGKAVSSLNAVKTGLCGRTVLLASEDVAAYQAHIASCEKEFQPVGDRERTLVQNLADAQWRLDRIPNLETGLFVLGRLRFTDLFAEEKNEPVRRAMIDAHILREDAKHFKNLHLQENRLLRRYQQEAKELKELQAQRKKEQEQQEEQARKIVPPKSLTASVGFEFTTDGMKPGEQEKSGMDRCERSGSALLSVGSGSMAAD